jgi:hypothetical protein
VLRLRPRRLRRQPLQAAATADAAKQRAATAAAKKLKAETGLVMREAGLLADRERFSLTVSPAEPAPHPGFDDGDAPSRPCQAFYGLRRR